ncbi:uncharacterized protein LOC133795216 [Humulus lupulus]|uniref:uncharacterized protein LOC133795216 n=1 Tax=Humulus lupulus TaxID=3486 RepID=UPI002B403B5A|nr:uncharacterized protein LOC133795216 [Humulus lupulus]
MAEPDKLDYRCSPHRIFTLISHMNGGQKEMLKELGFGTLLGMRDCNLRKNLIFWLLSRFNVDDGSLDVHGKHFKLDSKVFSATMGVNDGVEDLQRHGNPVEQPFYKKGEKNTVSLLEEKLRRRELVDMSFVRQFLLFFVSVFLLPNTSLHVAREVEGPIMSLTDVAAVCRVNWASMAYTHIWKSIRRYHGKASKFVGGCVYFLQVFYCHHIIWKEGYVDRSLCPIGFWCDDDTKALLDWVEEEGGFESNTVSMG